MATSRHDAVAYARLLTAVLGLSLACAPPARAATLTWWATGSSGSTGGTGTWNTSDLDWTIDGVTWSNWTNPTVPPDTAVFAGTAGTVTLSEPITVGGLTFTTTGYTITGDTLTLDGGTAALSLGSGISASIGSTLSGTAVLQKTGAGTLTLSSSNNYSAGTTVSAGRIVLGSDFSLGSGAVTLDGGEIERNVANSTVANAITVGASGGTIVGRATTDGYTTFSGQLTGSGPLTVQGLVALSNTTNTYSGTVSISNASTSYLRLAASEVLGDTTVVSFGGGNSNLRLDGGVTETISAINGAAGSIFSSDVGSGLTARLKVGSGSFGGTITTNNAEIILEKVGSGTLTLSNANTYAGGTVLSGGILSLGNDSALGTGTLTFAGGAIRPTATRTVSNAVAAAASTSSNLIDGGSGDLLYTGAGTGSGTLVANSTTSRSMWLQGDWSGFTGTIQINVNGGGTNYRLGGTPGATSSNTGTNGSNFSQTRFVLSGGGSDRGLMWNGLQGATVQIGELSGSGGRITDGADGRSANWQVGALNTSSTAAVVITGGAMLTKVGSGTLTLTGGNTFTGSVTVNAGTIRIGNQVALGAANTAVTKVIVNAGGAVDLNGVNDATYGYTISGSGPTGAGAIVNTGAAIGTGIKQTTNVKLGADAAIGGSANWAILAGSYAATTLDLNGFTLTKTGANTIYLVNNTIQNSGTIAIAQGTLALFNNPATGTGATIVLTNTSGATLDLGGQNLTIGALAGGGSSGGNVINSATLTTGGLNTNSTYAGVISGGGAVVKQGTGSMTFTGGNSYTGLTTVSGGTLQLGSGGSTGSVAGNVSVSSGANLTFFRSDAPTYAGTISGSGTVTSLGSGTLTLSSANSYSGGTLVSAGRIVLGNNAALGTGTVTLNGGTIERNVGNVTVANAISVSAGGGTIVAAQPVVDYTNFSGALSGTGALTLSGLVQLSGTGTYSGAITLATGTTYLRFSSTSAVGPTTSIFSSAGGYIRLDSVAVAVGTVNTNAQVFNVGSGTGTLQVSSGTLSGPIVGGAGPLAITKSDTGTLLLSASNSFTGPVTVNGGTVKIGAMNALGAFNTSVTKVVVNGGGAVDFNGQIDPVYGYTISGSGPTGAGALVNTGAAIGLGTAQTTNVRLGADAAIGGSANWALLGSGFGATTLDLNGFTLTKTGPNTIYLVNNTILNTGTIAITQGWLALNRTAATGTGATIVLTNTSSAALDLGGQNLAIGALAGGGSSGGNVINAATLTTGGLNTNTTYAGAITGVGALVKAGTGTMTLTGANTYSGATTISAGALEIGGSGVLNSGAYAATITNSSSFVYSSSAAQTLSGAIGGPGNILKSGSGTLTLTGVNTYTGTTTITTGTLVVNAQFGYSPPIGSRLGNAVTIGSGATLSTSQAHQLGWNTSSMADVTIHSGGRLLTNNNDQFVGNIVLNGSASISASSGYIGIRGDLAASPSGGGFATIATGSLFLPSSTDTVPGYNGGVHTFTINDDGSSAADLTIPVAIYGGGSLTKAGAGKLLLSASNSWSGGTTLSAGVMSLGNAGALGTTGTISFTGGTLQFTGSNTTDYSNRFSTAASQAYSLDTNGQAVSVGTALTSSGGSLTKLGSGTLTLTANNTYAGNTTIAAGVLRLGNGNASGSVAGAISVASGASLAVNRSDAFTLSSAISGSGGLLQIGSGTTTLGVVNTYSGPTSITSGVLAVSTDSRLGTVPGSATPGSIVIDGATLAFTSGFTLEPNRGIALGPTVGSGSGTIDVASGQTLIYGGVIANNGAGTDGLVKAGAGVLSLTGSATYTGDTSVNDGTLQLGFGSSLASPLVTVASGATLSGGGTVNAVTVASGGILAPGITNSGTLATGNLTFSGSATVTMGVTGGLPTNLLSVLGNVTPSGGAGSVVFAFGGGLANIGTGTYSLMTYTGSLTDSSAFGYTGTTGGRQSVAISGTTVAGAVSLVVGNAFPIWTGTNGNDWFASDNWELNTDLSPTNFQNNDTVDFNDLATTASGTVVISGSNATPASVTFSANTKPYTLDSTGGYGISTGSVIKSGSALVTITNANTYGGGTTLSAGRLRVGDDSALGSGAVTVSGSAALSSDGPAARTLANGLHLDADLTLGDTSDNGDLTISGTVTFDGASRTITTPSNVTLSGLVTNGGLTKAGAGVMTITGSNTYANGTTLSAGTLRVANNAALGGGGVTLAAGTLSSADTSPRTLANAFTIAGDVTLGDTLNSGTLTLGSSGISLGNGTRQVTTASDVTFAGTVTNGGLTKAGAGTLTLATANSYAAGTTLSAGNIVMNNVAALGTGAATYAGAGAIRTTVGGTIANALSVSAGISGTFDSAANSLTLPGDVANAGTFTLTTAATQTLSGVVSGSGAIVKAGSGRLVLTATSTYSGDTTISAGTLEITGAGQLGGGTYGGAIANSGTLAVTTSANQTISGAVSGIGSLSKSNAGTLTLSNASNSYSGGSTITGGTVAFASGALGSAGTVSVSNAALRWADGNTQDLSARLALVNSTTATLDTGGNVVTFASGFGGGSTAALVKAGAGTLSITGTATYTGPTTISAGVLDIAGAGLLGGGSYAGAITNSGTLWITTSAAQTISGVISGTGAVSKAGAATLVLTASNTYSGVTTVSGGTLQLGAGGTTGSITGNVSVAAGANLTFNRSDSPTYAGIISGAGSVTKLGAGTLTLSSSSSYSGGTTLSAGVLSLANNGVIGTGTLTFAGGTASTTETRAVANPVFAAAATTSGLITGGAGDLMYSGTGTGSGTLVADSTASRSMWLQGDWSGFTGTIQFVVNGAGTNYRLGGTPGATSTNTGTNGSDFSQARFLLSGAGTDRGLIWNGLPGATVQVGELSGSGGRIIDWTGGQFANWQVGSLNTSSTAAVLISGGGSLTKVGSGTLTLTAASTYTGNTTVNAGVLKMSGSGQLYSGGYNGTAVVTVGSGGRLELDSFDYGTAGGLGQLRNQGNARVLTGGTIAVVGGSQSSGNNFSVASGSSGGFAMTQFGQLLTLAGNTNSNISIGGPLTFGGAGNITVNEVIQDNTGVGSIIKAGLGTLTFGTAMTYTGSTTIDSGTFLLTGAGQLGGGSYAGAFTNNAAFVSSASANQAFSGVVSGSGSFTKNGAGTLAFTNGANSFTGNVSLTAGVLSFVTGGLGTTGTITLGGGTLQWASGNSQDVSARLALVDGVAAALDTNGNNVALASTLGGGTSTSLVKIGGGALALSASNSFTGGLTVSAGTLRIGNDAALGSGTLALADNVAVSSADTSARTIANAVAVNGDVTLGDATNDGSLAFTGPVDFGGATRRLTTPSNVTIAAAVANAVGLTKAGAGTLTLSASNTYTGATSIDAGTLALVGEGDISSGSTALVTIAAGAALDISGASGARTIGELAGGDATSQVFLGGNSLRSVVSSVAGSFGGVISGSGGFTKAGAGPFEVTSIQAFTGPATVEEGNLLLASGTGLASASRIEVASGASIETYEGETLVILGSQSLGGYGTVIGPVSFASGAILSPGGSVGTLTNDGSTTWNAGFTYLFEINDASGTTPGESPGWDLYNVTGTLTLAAGVEFENQIVVDLTSLSGTSAGPAAGFDENSGYAWLIADAGAEITTFNPTWFRVNTTNFLNLSDSPERFSVVRGDELFGSGNNTNQLYLVYAAVPEPSTLVLAGIGLAAAGWAARRRRV